MTLAIKTAPVPLSADATGTVRVGGTRVTLDTVVGAFSRGATAEQIVQQYPTLDLADVYAVISRHLADPEGLTGDPGRDDVGVVAAADGREAVGALDARPGEHVTVEADSGDPVAFERRAEPA